MPTYVTLKVYRGDELIRTERFTRDIIKIGRLSSAHLCLEDERVSRIHSVIEASAEGHLSIVDMGSAEGTFVNGKRISKGPIHVGDEIKVGGLRIVVGGESADGAKVAEPAAQISETVHGSDSDTPELPLPGLSAQVGHAEVVETAVRPEAVRAQDDLAAIVGVSSGGPSRGGAAVAQAVAPARESAPAAAPRPHRTAMAVARPVREEPEVAGAPQHGVELRLFWGNTLLDAGTFVEPARPILVGQGRGCQFQLNGPALPSSTFPILRYADGEYRFLFARSMSGGVQDEAGQVRTFADLLDAKAAVPDDEEVDAFAIAVPRQGVVRAEIGSGLRLEARFRKPPRAAVVPWWERVDYRYLNLLLLLLFINGAFVVAANTTTRDIDLVQDDLAKGQQRMAKFVLKEEAPKKNPYLEKLKKDLKKDPGEMAEKHRGEEGKMGKRDAPKTNGRSAPRAIDPKDKELVKNSGILAAFGKGAGASAGLSTVFGKGGLGGDIKGAIGNMYGPVVGDSRGVGGLGLKGTGTGGGGSGDTIGIGAVGTKGRGGGLGGSGYGSGVGGLGSKRDRDVAISTGDTRVLGSIDAELIRKVIRDHADQVRYCYEQRLTLNPKLTGKVSIKWIINASGRVESPSIVRDGTTLSDDEVGRCIMARLQEWSFPKPKGGGEAIVTYPWILRSSGSSASSG